MRLMGKTLEVTVRELNPLHDLNRVLGAESLFTSPRSFIKGQQSGLKEWAYAAYGLVNTAKHALRGGIAGGLLGYLASIPTGISAGEATRNGAVIGLVVDVNQYMIRSLWENTFKEIPGRLASAYKHFRSQ